MGESSAGNSGQRVKLLIFFLWIVALHSFLVGLYLILFPPRLLNAFGFEVTEKFFPTYAGVFHLVMASICIFALRRLTRCTDLVELSIFIKFLVALSLFVYYFSISKNATVILTGIAELFMGIILLFLLIRTGLTKKDKDYNKSL